MTTESARLRERFDAVKQYASIDFATPPADETDQSQDIRITKFYDAVWLARDYATALSNSEQEISRLNAVLADHLTVIGEQNKEIEKLTEQEAVASSAFAQVKTELDRLQASGAGMREALAKLRASADQNYVNAIQDAMHKETLLGADWKLENGKFGKAELVAHQMHAKTMARHFALHEACNAIEAAHPEQAGAKPVAWRWWESKWNDWTYAEHRNPHRECEPLYTQPPTPGEGGEAMIVCPKCDSHHISGPRYESRGAIHIAFHEFLRYTCMNCGYSETRPCHDAQPKAPATEPEGERK